MNDYSLCIARVIANFAIFLEFSGDNLVAPDASLAVTEQLSSDIRLLDEASQKKIAEAFLQLADEYEGEIREFVRNLPETLGMFV